MVTSDIQSSKKKKVEKKTKQNWKVKKKITMFQLMFQKASRADSYNSIKGHTL